MAYEDKVFRDEFLPNIQSANKTSYGQWKQSNPKEAAAWEKYRDAVVAYKAGNPKIPVPNLATKYGKALVAAGKLHVSVTDIGADYTPAPPPPPPPPPSNAYTVEDWSSGAFNPPIWERVHSYQDSVPGSGGSTATPCVASVDGRVSVVNNPGAGGGKAARCEIRDSDPDWAGGAGLDKSEIVMNVFQTWNRNVVNFGDVRWYSVQMYFPYTATEKFEWAHGGGQNYYSLWGLHTQSNQLYSAIILGWEHYQFLSGGDSYQDKNVQLNFHAIGGVFPDNTYSRTINLGLKLTDANGARVMANHNRWVNVVWGIKHNPDNTGWVEGWVDGVNTYPRTNGPTIWSIEDNTSKYFKYGMYRKSDGNFPESGKSVIYYGATAIGTDRPF